MAKKRVVVTGLGVLTSIGNDVEAFCQGLKEGKNGVSKLETIEMSAGTEAIKVKDCMADKGGQIFDLAALDCENYGKTLAFARKAVSEAIVDSDLDIRNDQDLGIVIGTSLGNFEYVEKSIYDSLNEKGISSKVSADDWMKSNIGNVATTIAEEYSLKGPKLTISTACAAGTNSLAYAYELIKKGYCDKVLTGGADSIYSISFAGFASLMSLTRDYPKPFDKNRDGLVLGEGAGILVLEDEKSALKRGADIYAEVTGYSLGNDAYHVTSPNPDGSGLYRCMEQCLKNSGMKAEDVQHVNAHGTGTRANDIMELKVINELFKENTYPVYVTSNKSMFGHCLGAAGSIEAVSTILSIKHNFIPPTINTSDVLKIEGSEESVVELVCGQMIAADISFALSNSAAFAGNIAVIGFKKY